MLNARQGYKSVGQQYEPVDEGSALFLQDFDEAIQTLRNYENNLAKAQELYKIQVENKIGQVNITGIPKELPSAVELRAALKELRNRVVEDVNDEGFSASEAIKIAKSAKVLTRTLTDPNLNFDIDKKHQAIKEFQEVAYPISKTRIALTMLVGVVIGAAVTFLLNLFPQLILGAKLVTLLASVGGITTLSFGGALGLLVGALFSVFRNSEGLDVVSKALDFAPKPGFFGTSVIGLLFQKTNKPQESRVTEPDNSQQLSRCTAS